MEKTQHIRYFLFSQYLSDGIRITLSILLPALICSQWGRLDIGMLLSTGALCVSISDAPGPLEHKRNAMWYCNGFVFLMALLTGLANHNIILLTFLILLASFFFSMFAVFGTRASSVGIAALLVMILNIEKADTPLNVIRDAMVIMAGGFWYMALALSIYLVRPFRQAQRSLGDCIHQTSKLLLIKAALYDPLSNVEEEYKKMLAQQVIVSQLQDEVRELLFKGKEVAIDTTRRGQVLLITFTDAVDLYEQITATWYDYSLLRERFAPLGILPDISALIRKMAQELDSIGLAIQSNIPYRKQLQLLPALNDLKAKIDIIKIENTSTLVLKKILINLRNLGEHTNAISNYFAADIDLKTRRRNRDEYSKFVSHQEISIAVFRNNMGLGSSVFRHSLRMMLTCVLGFIVARTLSYGHHSYWILLTIVIILKPGYSITKQRNIERIAGTLGGGLLAIMLIATIHNRDILFSLMVFFMIGTYTFQRLNYIVMVIFMTPYILILFSFLGLGFLDIIEERVLDTAIGSLLAFLASYFLFPHWESNQLYEYMTSVLKANIIYLKKLRNYFSGNAISSLEYKLVRKELYVSAANLSAALTRMLSEPKNKQQHATEINEFVSLNNVLSSNIASLFAVNVVKDPRPMVAKEILQPLNRSVNILSQSLKMMDDKYAPSTETIITPIMPSNKIADLQMKEHVDFVFKIAADIHKVVLKINPSHVGRPLG